MDEPPVGLQLGLAGAPGADGPLLPLQVLPHTGQPGQQVLVLGQLHLEPALAGPGPLGEDVQNEGRAVQHLDTQHLAEHPLLGGAEVVVKDDQVGLGGRHQLPDLVHLALPQKGLGVGGGLVLQHRAHADAAGGLQKSLQLGQGLLAGRLPPQGGGIEAAEHGLVDFGFYGFLEHKCSFLRPTPYLFTSTCSILPTYIL